MVPGNLMLYLVIESNLLFGLYQDEWQIINSQFNFEHQLYNITNEQFFLLLLNRIQMNYACLPQLITQLNQEGQVLATYMRGQFLGAGGFAHCFQVKNLKTKQKLAAKIISKKQLSDRKSRNKLLLEINIHRELKHKNIVRFYQVFEDKDFVYILMQLCTNQTLKQLQKRRNRLLQLEVKYYTMQLLQGLYYLHQKRILHRDLKLGNIFLTSNMEIRIGDFGLSTKLKNAREKRYTTCGTPNYIAPQILQQNGHSFSADIWALGVIVYTLLIGKPPFQCDTVQETYQKIKTNNFVFPVNVSISQDSKDFISSILKNDPQLRPSLNFLLQHPFLNNKLNKFPDYLPNYTISIPPQGNFLRQYVPDTLIQLAVLPRKLSKFESNKIKVGSPNTSSTKKYNSGNKNEKIIENNKLLFLSNQNLKKNKIQQSQLNKGQEDLISKRKRILTQIPQMPSKRINKNSIMSNQKKQNQYPLETIQIQKQQKMSKRKLSKINIQSPRYINCDQIIIQNYVDLSHKYGIGYSLKNGNIGICLNDQTSITKLQSGNWVYYDHKKTTLIKTPAPSYLLKKIQILKLVEVQLKKQNKMMSPRNKSRIENKSSQKTYVKKYLKYKNALIIKLSDARIQFFWEKDTIVLKNYKLLFWKIKDWKGEGNINQQFQGDLNIKINTIKHFLRDYSQRILTKIN